MIPTFVLTAALAVGAYEPVPTPAAPTDIHKVPGPAFLIPCKVAAADRVTHVQLWVSADRGQKWDLYEEITPDKPAFTFIAKKPGEYWFAPRIKKKDGTLSPADTAELVATQRVAVATGSDSPEPPARPLARPTAKPTTAEAVAELDDELTRVELELIRKEIKRLSEEKELTPEAEDKFDRLRGRLRDLRERLRPDRDYSGTTAGPWGPATASPALPPPAVVPSTTPAPPPDDPRIPPSRVPTDPLILPSAPMPVPARPVAPMPRVPER
jgi:hypothetical protein